MHLEIMEALDVAERTRVPVQPLTATRPGLTPADAYAVQGAWLEHKLDEGGRLAGRWPSRDAPRSDAGDPS